jgi:HAD superfamily hydrolase (TIGR01490 family)
VGAADPAPPAADPAPPSPGETAADDTGHHITGHHNTGHHITGHHNTGHHITGHHNTGRRGERRLGARVVPLWRDRAARAGAASAAAAEVQRPPPVPDLSAGAFFDVDNTLMRGASLYYFARGLAARKLFGPADLARMIWGQVWFRVVGAENSSHIDAARQAALAFVAGHRVDDIVALGEEIYDETMAARIWEGTRALAQRHLDAGQRVWLVTATPVELAGIMARRLGFTGALGTVAESSGGVYTGRLVGELLHGPAKAAAVAALAAREGLDLTRCSAYSDSINDLPMLRLVGHPVAVNPDTDLRAEAKAAGWPVHDFRSGRRATMVALPTAAGAGAVAGGVAAGMALRRRYARR